jgi:hypothetical protein
MLEVRLQGETLTLLVAPFGMTRSTGINSRSADNLSWLRIISFPCTQRRSGGIAGEVFAADRITHALVGFPPRLCARAEIADGMNKAA